MGAREKDLNPDVYIGLQLPLGYDDDGFFTQTKTTIKQAQYNIINLLKTIPGERLGQPLYGSRLHHLLFEPMTEDLSDRIKVEIKDALDTWLPYITVQDIKIAFTNSNHVDVSIIFGLSFNPTAMEQVSIDFTQFEDFVGEVADVGIAT
ncbi:MAG TPA: GPW/gp25 family protein [Candidatus Poseidoniia archaeon]|jgi:phage baseplate assembly protein W|nr:GPW/gp25 family protein [Candidatus Poseidoniia archaeon]|tara:strand:+ start:11 stop:457 length:447 start_codon:yes stop_codon:yes gene_type:complete